VDGVKRITVIAVGCGLTWASAMVGAVRLHGRLRAARVPSAEVAPPITAPCSSAAETVATEESVAEPVAESPADEDENLAAATLPRARILRLHPLEGPFAEPDAGAVEQEGNLELPPAGIDGLRRLNLGWSRDGALELLVLLSTATHEYGQPIVTESALPDPTWAAFDTRPIGDALVIAIGWGVTPARSFQYLACEHYTVVCQLGEGGVPSCAAPVLVARAPVCRRDGFGAGLPVAVPTIRRRSDYIGDLVLVDGVTFDPEQAAFSPVKPAAWNRKTSDFQAQELGPYTGIRAVRLLLKPRQTHLQLELSAARGEFVGRLRRSRRAGTIGWLGHWAKKGTLLIGWTVGVGVLDPPESTYAACEHDFVVCRMDPDDVPWCSDAVTLARTARCVEDEADLDEDLSAPTWAPDGSAFRIEGRRFRIDASRWKKP